MNIYEKLYEIQNEMKEVKKGATNPFFKSKYFDINALIAVLRPVMRKHKLILIQPLSNAGGKPAIKTILINSEDPSEIIEDTVIIPELSDPQKMGSAITYFRRYALQSLFLLEAVDDDANLASGNDYIDTITKIKNTDDFLKYYNEVKDLKNFDKEIMPLLAKKKSELTEKKSNIPLNY